MKKETIRKILFYSNVAFAVLLVFTLMFSSYAYFHVNIILQFANEVPYIWFSAPIDSATSITVLFIVMTILYFTPITHPLLKKSKLISCLYAFTLYFLTSLPVILYENTITQQYFNFMNKNRYTICEKIDKRGRGWYGQYYVLSYNEIGCANIKKEKSRSHLNWPATINALNARVNDSAAKLN